MIILALLASNAWGQTAPHKVTYTDKEYVGLLGCVGMTDAAWVGAQRKLKGVSLADAKRAYDGLQPAQKNLSQHVLDKVYSDAFTNAGDYAVSFYSECAQNVADVGSDREMPASFCMQNSMIGMAAWEHRNAGDPKESVYQLFCQVRRYTGAAQRDRSRVRRLEEQNRNSSG